MTDDRRSLRVPFQATEAPRLAAAIGLDTLWASESRTSDFFAYFADPDRLAVVAGPHEKPADVDKALAYGLSYSGDRDLVLVLPAGACWPTLARVAFMDVPIRVFEHDEAGVRPLVVPSRREVLDGMRTGLVAAVHELAARAPWVEGLVAWADGHPDLTCAHRQSYLSWHCRGRQVLRVQKVGRGLQVVGGVQERGSRRRLASAVVLEVGGAVADADLAALRAAVESAVDARLRGVDRLPDEHWLQSVLGADPERLGLARVQRELPAFRPGHPEPRRGFVDLVGVDARGRVHLVETKLGGDEMLVLQGLDYWVWAEANRAELTHLLEVAADAPFQIDFVVAAEKGVAIGTHSASQAESLAGEIGWRFREVVDWFGSEPKLREFRRRTLIPAGRSAPPARHTSPRFAHQLQASLAARFAALEAGVFHRDPVDGILPDALGVYRDLEARGLLHRFVGHVRSSQAFAINLFGPLDDAAVIAILAGPFGPMGSVQRPRFEFSNAEDRLHERSAASQHTTQVDVVLTGVTEAGQRVALFVEVKLSEIDFGGCSAWARADGDQRVICLGAGAFGGRASECLQLANRGDSERRRYDEYIGDVRPTPLQAGCAFRGGLNQPMRNIALAKLLIADASFDRVAYALCAHDRNVAIWRRWREAKAVFGAGDVALLDLPASSIVGRHAAANGNRAALARRYAF